MANQSFSLTSGFYDAIDYDRLYSADQMNMPYKRIVSNGVFAANNGTVSSDFQVTAQTGMSVKVSKGMAICGDKWLELDADQQITIAANSGQTPRIDSIIIRTDKTSGVRAASLILREGTPASSPQPPALTNNANISELRAANIRVNAGASSITQSNITDLRGSDECPWITGLIQQVDTSTLFEQYNAAYNEKLAQMQAQWNEFFRTLTQDLSLSTAVLQESGSYTTTASTTLVPITDLGINDFDSDTDAIEVFINGLLAKDRHSLVYAMPVVEDVTAVLISAPTFLSDEYGEYAVNFESHSVEFIAIRISSGKLEYKRTNNAYVVAFLNGSWGSDDYRTLVFGDAGTDSENEKLRNFLARNSEPSANKKNAISLTNALPAGNEIFAVVYKSVISGNATLLKSVVGSPLVASTAAEMTDPSKIYVYTGSETGYTSGNWYYYNGTAWVSGGVYNSTAVNTLDSSDIQSILNSIT